MVDLLHWALNGGVAPLGRLQVKVGQQTGELRRMRWTLALRGVRGNGGREDVGPDLRRCSWR